MKRSFPLLFLLVASLAYGESECEKAIKQPATQEPSQTQDSLHRFADRHREIALNSYEPEDPVYFPEFSSKTEHDEYYRLARENVEREKNAVSKMAEEANHVRTAFDFMNQNAGRTPTLKYYQGLWGEVLQKNQFKELNRTLGSSGIWFVFRSYSWDHLGFQSLAGPHMSVIIGDRVYEIGRPLKRVGNELKLSTRGPAGPLSISIDEFLQKTSLESEALQAKPGIFFAERLAGVGERELKALAKYYETQAEHFKDGTRFKYSMDPSEDPDGRNCVTYLTEPMLNPDLTQGLDLKMALGLRRYTVSPVTQMMETVGIVPTPKFVSPFLVVDNENWRTQLDAQVSNSSQLRPVEDAAFPGLWFDDEGAHPQIRGFFFRRMKFYLYPR